MARITDPDSQSQVMVITRTVRRLQQFIRSIRYFFSNMTLCLKTRSWRSPFVHLIRRKSAVTTEWFEQPAVHEMWQLSTVLLGSNNNMIGRYTRLWFVGLTERVLHVKGRVKRPTHCDGSTPDWLNSIVCQKIRFEQSSLVFQQPTSDTVEELKVYSLLG